MSKEQLAGFDKYKYSSIDTSPLSKYVMHPFWNQLVKVCPLWFPANLLTLTGWLLSFFFFLLVSYYDPHFVAVNSVGEAVPRWVWLAGAICIFWSHQLDGIDGKQARRTNSSSPLGELFDHGLDSSIVSLMAIGIFSIFGISENTALSWEIVILFIVVLFGFYVAHWEKYTTSILYLPWAYDVSQIFLSGSYLLTFIYGPEMWRSEVLDGWSVALVLKACLYGICPTLLPISLYNQYVARKEHPEKCVSVLEGLVPVFSFTAVTALHITFVYLSTDIIQTQLRLLVSAYGLLYSNINCRLILAQMTNSKCDRFNVLAWPLFPMIIASHLKLLRDDVMLSCFVIFLCLCHLHYGVNVVRQLCDHLNVYCFKVEKPPPTKIMNGHTHHANGTVQTNGTVSNGKCAQD